MNFLKLSQTLTLTGFISMGLTTYAASLDEITCPTIEELKQLTLLETAVDSFDKTNQKINFYTLSGVKEEYSKGWSFLMKNLQAEKGDDLEVIYHSMMEKLSRVSSEPFQYSMTNYSKYKKLPVCIYNVEGEENIQAIAEFSTPFTIRQYLEPLAKLK